MTLLFWYIIDILAGFALLWVIAEVVYRREMRKRGLYDG